MRKSFIVQTERLNNDTAFAAVLSYPKLEKAELKKRLEELKKLGVKSVEFKGDKQVCGVNVLGKGCVGIVVLAHIDDKKAALKVRRLDADRSTMEREAEMLQRANSVGVGPKLLGHTSNLLLMQFVSGLLLPRWLRRRVGKVTVKRVFREIVEQCWLLDGVGLDHGELSHAPKHIIVDRANRPFIVDFETASANRNPANVTSICQFLFISGISTEVARKIGRKDKSVIIEKLRLYKKGRSRETFELVLKACGLQTT